MELLALLLAVGIVWYANRTKPVDHVTHMVYIWALMLAGGIAWAAYLALAK